MAFRESIDSNTGYSSSTKIYHILHPSIPLPPESAPLFIADLIFSFFHSSSTPAFIDAVTDDSLSYSHFLRQVRYLSSSLRLGTSTFPPINSGDAALILSPSSLKIPVLYFFLLSIGAVVSPVNPLLSRSELAHIIAISNPKVAFAVSSSTALPTLELDSPEFDSLLTRDERVDLVRVPQSHTAAILYSSGTTGRIKGVELTHRNLIALISAMYHTRQVRDEVGLLALPLFHVFGVFMVLRALALAETSVLLPKFCLEGMLSTIQRFKVTYMPLSPPVVVLLVKSELSSNYNLQSLLLLRCGGAPLTDDILRRFNSKFLHITCSQGYGLTETSGVAARPIRPEVFERNGSVGRLFPLMQAKIVDPSTNEALPPGHRGEMWLRGPNIMKAFSNRLLLFIVVATTAPLRGVFLP